MVYSYGNFYFGFCTRGTDKVTFKGTFTQKNQGFEATLILPGMPNKILSPDNYFWEEICKWLSEIQQKNWEENSTQTTHIKNSKITLQCGSNLTHQFQARIAIANGSSYSIHDLQFWIDMSKKPLTDERIAALREGLKKTCKTDDLCYFLNEFYNSLRVNQNLDLFKILTRLEPRLLLQPIFSGTNILVYAIAKQDSDLLDAILSIAQSHPAILEELYDCETYSYGKNSDGEDLYYYPFQLIGLRLAAFKDFINGFSEKEAFTSFFQKFGNAFKKVLAHYPQSILEKQMLKKVEMYGSKIVDPLLAARIWDDWDDSYPKEFKLIAAEIIYNLVREELNKFPKYTYLLSENDFPDFTNFHLAEVDRHRLSSDLKKQLQNPETFYPTLKPSKPFESEQRGTQIRGRQIGYCRSKRHLLEKCPVSEESFFLRYATLHRDLHAQFYPYPQLEYKVLSDRLKSPQETSQVIKQLKGQPIVVNTERHALLLFREPTQESFCLFDPNLGIFNLTDLELYSSFTAEFIDLYMNVTTEDYKPNFNPILTKHIGKFTLLPIVQWEELSFNKGICASFCLDLAEQLLEGLKAGRTVADILDVEKLGYQEFSSFIYLQNKVEDLLNRSQYEKARNEYLELKPLAGNIRSQLASIIALANHFLLFGDYQEALEQFRFVEKHLDKIEVDNVKRERKKELEIGSAIAQGYLWFNAQQLDKAKALFSEWSQKYPHQKAFSIGIKACDLMLKEKPSKEEFMECFTFFAKRRDSSKESPIFSRARELYPEDPYFRLICDLFPPNKKMDDEGVDTSPEKLNHYRESCVEIVALIKQMDEDKAYKYPKNFLVRVIEKKLKDDLALTTLEGTLDYDKLVKLQERKAFPNTTIALGLKLLEQEDPKSPSIIAILLQTLANPHMTPGNKAKILAKFPIPEDSPTLSATASTSWNSSLIMATIKLKEKQ